MTPKEFEISVYDLLKLQGWTLKALIYNIQQLNRLVVKNSKVILLGRPTAFLTDKEQKEALHGIREINNQYRKIPDWPNYKVLSIKPFSKEQVDAFIVQYIRYISDGKNKGNAKNIKKYLNNIQKAEGKRILDISTRPVQMKMLMEILPYYDGNIDNMTVATLYSEFIDLVIRRELFKSSRRKFDEKLRHKFAKELAFWMWQNEIDTEIHIAKFDDELFVKYVKIEKDDDDDIESIKRDLLMGSILERKEPTGFYFPHRSFQEFLVAECLVDKINNMDFELSDCPFLTIEIQSFFIELIGRGAIVLWKKHHENKSKIQNENSIELLRTACEYFNLYYDRSLYKTSLYFKNESEYESLRRKNLMVNDILSYDANKTKTSKTTKKHPKNQTGKISKHKYNK